MLLHNITASIRVMVFATGVALLTAIAILITLR